MLKRATVVIAAIACSLVIGCLSAAPAAGAGVKQVGAGDSFSCALTNAGRLGCWGGEPAYNLSDVPKGTFQRFSAGNYHACALRRSGKAACWGDTSVGSTKAPGTWRKLESGYYGNCGIRRDQTIDCYGYDQYRTGIPKGRFKSVAMGGELACALRKAGTIACWGDEESEGVSGAPSGGEFKRLALGAEMGCAQKASGKLSCWGSDEEGLVGALDGKIAGPLSIALTGYCALPRQGAGTLICGAASGAAIGDPPSGGFIGLDAWGYGDHACGLRRDRSVSCWGDDRYGETDVPARFRPRAG